MQTLETARLILRPFAPEDAPAMHQLVYGDAEVARYYCHKTLTLEEVQRRMLWWSLYVERRDDGLHAVTRKEDGQVIGVCGLQVFAADWARPAGDQPTPFSQLVVELSYALGRDFHGRGYAAEAAAACIEYGFLTLRIPRIINVVDECNAPSINLMRRLGFRIERNLSDQFPGTVLGILDNHRL